MALSQAWLICKPDKIGHKVVLFSVAPLLDLSFLLLLLIKAEKTAHGGQLLLQVLAQARHAAEDTGVCTSTRKCSPGSPSCLPLSPQELRRFSADPVSLIHCIMHRNINGFQQGLDKFTALGTVRTEGSSGATTSIPRLSQQAFAE